jgi:hypothetical protein
MRGTEILATGAQLRGVKKEVIVYGTPKPGTVMQVRTEAGLTADNVETVEVYTPGADGNRRPIMVLLENQLSGKTYDDAYVSGQRGWVYFPVAGEYLNMRLLDVAGTGDDHSFGELLIVDNGTGKLIATTGSPESEPFQLLETITDPTADTVALCRYTGY